MWLHCSEFSEGHEKLQKTRAGTDGSKFLPIPRGIHGSKILKGRHQCGLKKNGILLTGRYNSMLAKRSPIQVLTARRIV